MNIGRCMTKLLYIESSPRKKRSSSIEVANIFLEEYKKQHKETEWKELDLWKDPLPEFDNDIIDAKYAIMHQQAHSEAQRKGWRVVEELIQQFKNADKYIFSLPMWNFSIPYRLKHYFDLLVQPGYTFTFSATEGYKGLILGKPVLVIYSRGGAYYAGSGAENLDLQKEYMETVLKFIGFNKIQSIFIEPTLASEEQKMNAIQIAKERAKQLAKEF